MCEFCYLSFNFCQDSHCCTFTQMSKYSDSALMQRLLWLVICTGWLFQRSRLRLTADQRNGKDKLKDRRKHTDLFGRAAALCGGGGGGLREATVQPLLSLLLPVLRWRCWVMVWGVSSSLGGLLGPCSGPGPCLDRLLSPKCGLEIKGAVGVRGAAEGGPQAKAFRFVHLAGRGRVVPDVVTGGRRG